MGDAPKRRGRPRKKSAAAAPSVFIDPHVLKALTYCRAVVAGEIAANKLARAACERQLRDLERSATDPAWPFEFSEHLAGRVCRFVEALPHVKGDLAGERIRLEGWQCFTLTAAFGWVRRGTNQRRFRRVVIYVPRGNGKSAISSAVAIYCLAADGEGGAEVYAAATTREQARIVWDAARQMLNKGPHGTALSAKIGVVAPSAPTTSSIYQTSSGSSFRPLSREADNLDGLNVHFACLDELHAHKTREVYDVMETGTGKRSRSLLWVISTAGSDTSGIGHDKKPARFTPEEYEIMKAHTYMGARLFTEHYSEFDDSASVVALNHHERWDGNGYPGHINPFDARPLRGHETPDGKARGKKGEEIPVLGRLVAIADVYDALCSRRVYKDPWDETRVLENLRDNSGTQFDPEMIEVFFSCLDSIHSIGERYPDSHS